jgi:hypothetical protein
MANPIGFENDAARGVAVSILGCGLRDSVTAVGELDGS